MRRMKVMTDICVVKFEYFYFIVHYKLGYLDYFI